MTALRKPTLQQPASGILDKIQTSELLITYSERLSFDVPIQKGKNNGGMDRASKLAVAACGVKPFRETPSDRQTIITVLITAKNLNFWSLVKVFVVRS